MTSAQLKAMTPDDGVTNSQSLCAPGAHVVGVLPVAWVMFRYLEPLPASRLSRRRLGGGSIGSTNSHCSSVNSFCRFFMTEAHQRTRLIRMCLT
jgi:hypothetical protein